jgi:hypothetical protein
MLARCKRQFWISAAFFSALVGIPAQAALPAPQAAPVLKIDGLGKGLAPLDGPWQFHLGDDPAYALPLINDATGNFGWEQLSVDRTWGAQNHPSYTGYAWYRRHVHLAPSTNADADFAMLIGRVDNVYEIYWNGVLVGHDGTMPPHPGYPYLGPARTFGLGPVRDGVLAIRVWKAPLTSFDSDQLGGFTSPPLVGSPTAVGDRKAALDYSWLRSRQYTFGLNSLYALVLGLCLLAWWRDRSQQVLLWMAVFCASPFLALFLVGLRLPLSFNFALGWLQPTLSLQDIGLWFLLIYLLKLSDNRHLVDLTRTLALVSIGVTSCDGLLTMLDWSKPWITTSAQIADAIFTAIFTAAELFPVVLVFFAFKKKLDRSRWVVAIAAFTTEMLSVVRIGAQQGSRYTHWTFGNKLGTPLFYVNGNAFTPQTLADTLLFLAILYAAYRYSVEAQRRQHELVEEFKSARELQQVLIPDTLPSLPGYAVTSAYRPAQEVGGDFFQILPLEGRFSDSTLIILGDVSGKGLKAAMAVSMIVGAVRTLVETTASPSEILSGLNRRLFGRLQGGFVTCVAMRLDPRGLCVISSAGHPSPFANGQELHLVGSLPLGLVAQATYDEKQLFLRVGDHFSLYTDGLLEARNLAGEIYGFDRLQTLFAGRPDAAKATEAAVEFGQDDDITVLTLTRLAVGQESTTTLTIPMLTRTTLTTKAAS